MRSKKRTVIGSRWRTGRLKRIHLWKTRGERRKRAQFRLSPQRINLSQEKNIKQLPPTNKNAPKRADEYGVLASATNIRKGTASIKEEKTYQTKHGRKQNSRAIYSLEALTTQRRGKRGKTMNMEQKYIPKQREHALRSETRAVFFYAGFSWFHFTGSYTGCWQFATNEHISTIDQGKRVAHGRAFAGMAILIAWPDVKVVNIWWQVGVRGRRRRGTSEVADQGAVHWHFLHFHPIGKRAGSIHWQPGHSLYFRPTTVRDLLWAKKAKADHVVAGTA